MIANSIYACCDDNRKAAVLGNPTLNGIDYLEVVDHDAIALAIPRQQTLLVHCLNVLPADLAPANILITGGESITSTGIAWVGIAADPATLPPTATPAEIAYYADLPDAAKTLVVRTKVAGDFAPYLLRLVNSAAQAAEDPFTLTSALLGFDPELASVTFSFKVECPPDFDCLPVSECPPALPDAPPINYLAKDYGSFRTVLLDRLSQLVPGWGVATEADMGVVLAELVAYVGDYLSYQQDAVATEAYIETARSRISLRRHALLVDYTVHDGCNARTWMHLTVNAQAFLDHTLTRFYTFAAGMPSTLAVGAGNEEAALRAGVVVFQSMQDAVLYPEHNQMLFYTWGDTNCCLAAGATEATLAGSFPNLQPGDVLIFQEVIGPQTGNAADADMRHRCAVRLTQVSIQTDLGAPLVDPLFTAAGDTILSAAQTPAAVTEIQWSSEDALPFPVCISSRFIDSTGKLQYLTNVSVVLGNIVLADQGLQLSAVSLGTGPGTVDLPAGHQRPLQPATTAGWPARSLPPRSARQPDHPGRAAAAGRRAGYPRYRAARHRGLRQPAGCERLSRPQPSGRRPVGLAAVFRCVRCRQCHQPRQLRSLHRLQPRRWRAWRPAARHAGKLSRSIADRHRSELRRHPDQRLLALYPGSGRLHAHRRRAHGVPGQPHPVAQFRADQSRRLRWHNLPDRPGRQPPGLAPVIRRHGSGQSATAHPVQPSRRL